MKSWFTICRDHRIARRVDDRIFDDSHILIADVHCLAKLFECVSNGNGLESSIIHVTKRSFKIIIHHASSPEMNSIKVGIDQFWMMLAYIGQVWLFLMAKFLTLIEHDTVKFQFHKLNVVDQSNI